MTQAVAFALPPPPIQGIGNVGGFTMQVEIRNGDFDYALLQSLADAVVRDGNAQSALQRLSTTFRAGAPQLNVTVDRIKAETLGITVGNVFSALSAYVGSNYAAQFNKFGHVFQLYTQALPDYRASADDIREPQGQGGQRNHDADRNGGRCQEGSRSAADQPLQSLSVGDGRRQRGARFQFGTGARHHGPDRRSRNCRLEQATNGPRCPIRRRLVGAQIYFVFGLALLLVYFVLAGQYESWILPFAVILGVPLALLGTVGALTVLGAANNLYTQIGLILLIALGSKNAILVVEYARQRRAEGMEIVAAAVEGARLRFRPILMTSFAFILGVFPLVVATGAGAGARRSIGIAGLQRHDRVDLPRRRVCSLILCCDAAHPGAMDASRRA